jgi:hypothetical protein
VFGYVQHFAAVAGILMGGTDPVQRTRFDTVNVPGTEITLSQGNGQLLPTKGRGVDGIGFEVADIDALVARLRTAGIVTDGEIRNGIEAAGLRTVSITDPWGTGIEITQGLRSTPVAGSRP